MGTEKITLAYRSENDRCYGASGMAIGLFVFDGEDSLAGIRIDAERAADVMEMDEGFFFTGNPSLSAKVAWQQMVRNYHLSQVMTIANVLCRRLVADEESLNDELRTLLHDTVVESGREACSLEDDELDRLFEKDYNYLYRVFNHPGVHSVAHDLARELASRRTMSRMEIADCLRALRAF